MALCDSRKMQSNQTLAETLNIVFRLPPVLPKRMTGSGALGVCYRDTPAPNQGPQQKPSTQYYNPPGGFDYQCQMLQKHYTGFSGCEHDGPEPYPGLLER
jgi:hypothetical protein